MLNGWHSTLNIQHSTFNILIFGRTLLSTAAVVAAWSYFILTGSISQIWPMFGIANQLLAAVALCVGTAVILNAGRAKYAWTTMFPLAFVASTTLYAGWRSIFDNFLRLHTFTGNARHAADGDADGLRDRDPRVVRAGVAAGRPRRGRRAHPRRVGGGAPAHPRQRLLLIRSRLLLRPRNSRFPSLHHLRRFLWPRSAKTTAIHTNTA